MLFAPVIPVIDVNVSTAVMAVFDFNQQNRYGRLPVLRNVGHPDALFRFQFDAANAFILHSGKSRPVVSSSRVNAPARVILPAGVCAADIRVRIRA